MYNINKKGYKRIMAFIIFLIPFCYPFRPIINKITHIHVYIIMYSAIWILMLILLIKCLTIRISKWLVLIFLYYIFTFFLSVDYDTGLKWIINVLTGIVIAGVLNNYTVSDKFNIWFPMIWGCLACSILFLPKVIKHLPVQLNYNYEVRIPFVEGDISVGPNGWATTLSLALMILICGMYYKNIKFKKGFILLVFIGYFLVLTQSRTQIFSIIIVCGFYIFICIFDREKPWYIKGACFLIVLLSLVLFILMISGTISGNNRLSVIDLNGRDSIWELAFETFINKMNGLKKLFGVGTGGTSVYLYNQASNMAYSSGDHISAHNTYLDSLISSGIVGTIIVIGYWIRALTVFVTRRKKTIYIIFPLYILVSGVATHHFMSWEYGFIIAFTEIGLHSIYHNDVSYNIEDVLVHQIN